MFSEVDGTLSDISREAYLFPQALSNPIHLCELGDEEDPHSSRYTRAKKHWTSTCLQEQQHAIWMLVFEPRKSADLEICAAHPFGRRARVLHYRICGAQLVT